METKTIRINKTDFIETPKGEVSDLDNSLNDKTFNRLRDLQSLIKKESALKELCKKNKNYI